MIPSDWTPDEFEEKSHDLMLAVQMDITGALERARQKRGKYRVGR